MISKTQIHVKNMIIFISISIHKFFQTKCNLKRKKKKKYLWTKSGIRLGTT